MARPAYTLAAPVAVAASMLLRDGAIRRAAVAPPSRDGRRGTLCGCRSGHAAVQDEGMPVAERLIQSLRKQPLLIVLRPREPLQALPTLERLQALGLIHVEIAWQPLPGWAGQMAELVRRFPNLALGVASVCEPRGVADAAAAGCGYAVSPVLDSELQHRAAALDLVLVPGVMSPSEVHRARQLGCRLVKLFPAVSVGPDHWRRLREPLGTPLPFCIAAGGLRPADVLGWLAAGVDAVALGSGLGDLQENRWRELLAALAARSPQAETGTSRLGSTSNPHPT